MIRVRAPLRVSFFGGGTDFPEYFTRRSGAVLGMAVRRYVTLDFESATCGPLTAPARRAWRALGAPAELQPVVRSDVGTSVGLGTSSSCLVAVLCAADALAGREVAPLARAYEAARLERQELQTVVGCQDHVFAALGGLNVIEFRATDDYGVFRVPLDDVRRRELEAHLLLVDTGLRRRSGRLAARHVQRIEANDAALRFFRDSVDRGYRELTAGGSLAGFGELLDACWRRKRGLAAGVSSPQIDELYDAATDAGAWGGKLLGSGGGGYLLLCAPPERHAVLRRALGGRRTMSVELCDEGAAVDAGERCAA